MSGNKHIHIAAEPPEPVPVGQSRTRAQLQRESRTALREARASHLRIIERLPTRRVNKGEVVR